MHDRISINSICFAGASVSDVARHWHELAARRVGFVSTQLLGTEGDALRTVLADRNYLVETITHVFTPTLSAREADWHEPRTGLSRLIGAARDVGARSIYMLTGGRGDLDWERAAAAFSAAVAPCIAEARDAGVVLAVENALPLLAEIHIALSLRDAIALAEMAGIGVCIDIFGCWTEAGLDALIARAAPRSALVQVSDYVLGDRALPARAVPGDGAIPLRRILARLLDTGYAAGFDLELLGPRIDREGHVAAARRAARVVGEMLQELGA
jgi:sugar phosphate isomerase/epimerase